MIQAKEFKMQRYSSIIITGMISLVVITFSCTQKEDFDAIAVRTLIEEQNEKYMTAYNSKDANAVTNLHTEDVIVLPPNVGMKKGKKEIQETIAAEVQGGAQDLVLTTLDVYGSGDFAYEVGQYSLNVKQNGQITMQDTGNYIVIWNRQTNDSWLMKADIWNSNLPKD